MVENGVVNTTARRMSVVQRWLKGQWRVLSETCDAQEKTSLAPTKLMKKEVSGIERCSEPVPKTITSQSKKVTGNVQWKRKGRDQLKEDNESGSNDAIDTEMMIL